MQGETDQKAYIEYSDIQKLDLRVGLISEAFNVEGSEKLIKLNVDFGLELGTKVIFTAMAKYYKPEDFAGMKTVFVVNMKPKKIMGEESLGMIVAVELADGKPVFLLPREDVPTGSLVF